MTGTVPGAISLENHKKKWSHMRAVRAEMIGWARKTPTTQQETHIARLMRVNDRYLQEKNSAKISLLYNIGRKVRILSLGVI